MQRKLAHNEKLAYFSLIEQAKPSTERHDTGSQNDEPLPEDDQTVVSESKCL
jgi:hypothetical protein